MSNEDRANGQHRPFLKVHGTAENTRISNEQIPSNHTSNDLWSRLDAEYPPKAMNYEVVAQSADEVRDVRNAPPVSMGPWLVESGQMQLLTAISIYSERGINADQVRLLYMNATALQVWQSMGRSPTLVGTRHRPPSTALLMYGVPFSE